VVRKIWLSSFAALVAATSTVYAGHPMLSEDTGTQGRGNTELELGYAWSRLQGASAVFLFQPQLSYGTGATLDLIVQPSWTIVDMSGAGRERGLGDTNLDFKWRFYGATPWSVGVRAGLELPTAHADLGLPANKVSPHALLVLTADFTPLTVDVNLGYTRAPRTLGARPDLLHLSTAFTYAANERLFFVLDMDVDSNPGSTSTTPPAVALAGIIYTVHPGLDVDIGYRGRLNAQVPGKQWLLGITFRGAP
jgi:hypothetical protein